MPFTFTFTIDIALALSRFSFVMPFVLCLRNGPILLALIQMTAPDWSFDRLADQQMTWEHCHWFAKRPCASEFGRLDLQAGRGVRECTAIMNSKFAVRTPCDK